MLALMGALRALVLSLSSLLTMLETPFSNSMVMTGKDVLSKFVRIVSQAPVASAVVEASGAAEASEAASEAVEVSEAVAVLVVASADAVVLEEGGDMAVVQVAMTEGLVQSLLCQILLLITLPLAPNEARSSMSAT